MARCASIPLVCKEKTIDLTVVGTPAFDLQIFNSIADISPLVWESVAPQEHLFFNRHYLQALENSVGSEVDFRYLVIHEKQKPVGVSLFQLVVFKGENVENESGQILTFSERIKNAWNSVLTKVVNRLKVNIIICGNTYVTGEYGIYFNNHRNLNNDLLTVVEEGIEKIIEAEKPSRNISGVLIKDFYKDNKHDLSGLASSDYLEFEVNPNMILELSPDWKNFQDYLGAMSSKYRTRMKKALKICQPVKAMEMDLEELNKRLREMSSLYDQVIDESAFKLTKLNIGYLVELKKALKENFKIIGYYLDERLLSFITYYHEEKDLVAGFMGLERSMNKQYDIYLNVLLKLAEEGIKGGYERVVYGRTAMEIKSSVGALPRQMVLYTKHRNPVINWVVKRVVKALTNEPEWTLRSPFKE